MKPDDDARAGFWRCKNAICTFEIAPYLKPANFAKQRKGRIFGPAEKVRNPPHGVACVCALSTDCADWLWVCNMHILAKNVVVAWQLQNGILKNVEQTKRQIRHFSFKDRQLEYNIVDSILKYKSTTNSHSIRLLYHVVKEWSFHLIAHAKPFR